MSGVTYGTFDPRASKVGQMVRQSGLDELPQIINVLNGSMSLVGARPMIEEDIEFMELSAPHIFDEWHSYYQISKPGLAGPSQIYRHHHREGHSKEIYRMSAELDLQYFDKASLVTDLHILARTPIDMLRANVGVIENSSTSTGVEAATATDLA
jgi:lipopolysaccharide/colanic/teichoic acid biosynthesis glycosyltransferase